MKFIPYNKKLKDKAKYLRKNMTKAEKKIWFELLRKLNIKINRQKILGNYIVDFYCSKAKLVIEIDGDTHFSEEEIEYDANRTNSLNEFGLKVLRFTNTDVFENSESVSKIITEEISSRAKLSKEKLYSEF